MTLLNDVSVRDLEDELVRWVTERNEDEFAVEIDADTDLFAAGVLDSMGFVGLITVFEERVGREIDFERVDPAELVSIRALVRTCL